VAEVPQWGRQVQQAQGDQSRRCGQNSVVREILRLDVLVVRFGLLIELNRNDRLPSFEEAARHSVHPIHHLALCPEDHGIREINFVHKLHVTHKDPHRVWRTVSPKPMDGVQLPDRREGDLLDRETRRAFDQSVNVPSVEAVFARPEVVLLPHALDYRRTDPIARSLPKPVTTSRRSGTPDTSMDMVSAVAESTNRQVNVLTMAMVTALPPEHPEYATFSPFPVHAWVVHHEDGPILFDTGIGIGHAYIDAHYRPEVTELSDALSSVGLEISDLVAVVISHLHFDHCGQLRGLRIPTYVQETELEASAEEGYTVPEWATIPSEFVRPLHGDAEIARGVTALSTPGHTPGHQSLLIERGDHRILLAAQCAFGAEELLTSAPAASNLHSSDWASAAAASLDRIQSLAPVEVHLSHDAQITSLTHAP
jgi:N-acyl homoserine lactone hydrolase